MYNSIWKSVIPIDDKPHTFQLPYNSQVVHVACQDRHGVCVWTMGDPDAETSDFTFQVFGTGHLIPKDYAYCGTGFDVPFVWHVMRVL